MFTNARDNLLEHTEMTPAEVDRLLEIALAHRAPPVDVVIFGQKETPALKAVGAVSQVVDIPNEDFERTDERAGRLQYTALWQGGASTYVQISPWPSICGFGCI